MFHVSTTSTFREQPESSDNGCICKRLVVCICVTILVIVGSLVGIGLYVTHSNKTAPKAETEAEEESGTKTETKPIKWPSEMPAMPSKLTSWGSNDPESLVKELEQLQRLRNEMPKEIMCSTEPIEKFLPFKVKFPSVYEVKDIYCPPVFTPTAVWWAAKNANEDVGNSWVGYMEGGDGIFKFEKFEIGSSTFPVSYFRRAIWSQYQQYQNVPGTEGIPSAPEISYGVDVSGPFKQEYIKWCDVVKAAYTTPEIRSTKVVEVTLKDNGSSNSVYVNVPTPFSIKSVFYAITKECPDFAKEPFYVKDLDYYIAVRIQNQDSSARTMVWNMYDAFKLVKPPK